MTALWVVNFFYAGITSTMYGRLHVPQEKASANSVPAAAVIRKMRALSGFIGFKGCVGGQLSQRSKRAAQPPAAVETGSLEWARSTRNARCSGEMHR